MLLESEQDVLAWYESQPRVVTPAFVASVPWGEIAKTPLDPTFVPVMRYMRDVEMFTTLYASQMRQSPTWQDPSIRNFMERWTMEEPEHGNLLNRFLGEAGYPSLENWKEAARDELPNGYDAAAKTQTRLLSLLGREQTAAVHMTWGAVNEYSTLTAYQRLWQAANHPVLETILRAIAREEAMHSFFYWSMARIKLKASKTRRAITRFLLDRFWQPIGADVKGMDAIQMVLRTLFAGADGLHMIEQQVNRRLQELPGFETDTVVRDRVARMVGM